MYVCVSNKPTANTYSRNITISVFLNVFTCLAQVLSQAFKEPSSRLIPTKRRELAPCWNTEPGLRPGGVGCFTPSEGGMLGG